ncbi:DUF4097 family beta strand repeat-containing protein [Kitasatospora purpeofusca]|uniref:DUF4097 family beta strand repeat-containing protein n=1 Tax=Kitasatospora purpeofusca TaxID=67352 RepID=UPI002A59C951|nr:DUF4097 family beta strand repeat-containing protein [Kitasatospora purpeofusca]MDY0816005.1 DUF4097 family beta strand repeat-containing protein [Kitasatospora purpeofusca]
MRTRDAGPTAGTGPPRDRETTTARPTPPAPGPARAGHRGWRVFGTLALVVVMLIGAVQTWAMAVQQQTRSERTYGVAVTKVRLDTGRATVRIKPGQEGQVVVRQSLNWVVRMPVVSALFDQDELNVRMLCNQVFAVGDLGCGAVIELEVPPGVAVTGRQSSGNIDIAGVTGEIGLVSTSGEVRLADVSGPLTVRTTSGTVYGQRLTSPRADVAATSGSVKLDFVTEPSAVDIGVTSGSVSLGLPRGSRYDFEGGSAPRGGIDPALADRSSPHKVRISVSSGSVSVFAKDGDAGGGG